MEWLPEIGCRRRRQRLSYLVLPCEVEIDFNVDGGYQLPAPPFAPGLNCHCFSARIALSVSPSGSPRTTRMMSTVPSFLITACRTTVPVNTNNREFCKTQELCTLAFCSAHETRPLGLTRKRLKRSRGLKRTRSSNACWAPIEQCIECLNSRGGRRSP